MMGVDVDAAADHFEESTLMSKMGREQMLAEVKRHFDVAMESLTSQIQQVAEGVVMVNEKLDRHCEDSDQKFAQIEKQFLVVNAKLDQHSAKLDEHSAKLDEHSAKLDQHSAKLDEHSAQFQQVNSRIDRLQEEMLKDSEETRALIKLSYVELNRRLTTMEESLAVLTRRVDILETQSS
jgi:chromosome segregation ATPase